jgi:hypothetical protein
MARALPSDPPATRVAHELPARARAAMVGTSPATEARTANALVAVQLGESPIGTSGSRTAPCASPEAER